MRVLVFVLMLLAAPALALDGDFVESRKFGSTTMDVFKICDGATGGATKFCAPFDLTSAHSGSGTRPAVPDAISFSFVRATGCSGATTVMPMGMDEANSGCTANVAPYACCTGAGTGTCPVTRYDLAELPMNKPASSKGDQFHVGPLLTPNRYVTADIQTGTDCTDLEVWLKVFYFGK